MPIEVETPNGIQTLKLTYVSSQNPFEAAQAFIDKHQVGNPKDNHMIHH